MFEDNKPIRILQMIASLDFGGSQNMIINLYKAIDKTKIQFDFIVDHPEYNAYEDTVKELGARVFIMPQFKGNNVGEVKKAWDNFFTTHPEYKVLHSHSRSYASIYLPIAKKHKVKTIIHSHNTSNGNGLKAFIKDLMQYPLRFQADYYFACSKQAGQWLFGNKIVNGDRFHVINNAIDVQIYKYNSDVRNIYREQFNANNKLVLLQVGAFRYQKNYPFTIELAKELLKIRNDFVIYCVGNGPDKEELSAMIKENNLEDYVKILLDRKDVNCLLQMADIYLMPSHYEGLSVAAIEAQASGIKCLLSDQVFSGVKVTDCVSFLPLELNSWISEINKELSLRKDTSKEIKESGFDIVETSQWLKEFYERINN